LGHDGPRVDVTRLEDLLVLGLQLRALELKGGFVPAVAGDLASERPTARGGVRKLLAKRLRYEFRRRDVNAGDVSDTTDVPIGTVRGFLDAKSKYPISAAAPITRHVGVSLCRLVSPNYVPFRIWMHHLSPREWVLQGLLEEMFCLLRTLLPAPQEINLPWKPVFHDGDDIHRESLAVAKWMCKTWHTSPEGIIEALRLPVIPFQTTLDVLGCLLLTKTRAVICLNTAAARNRTRLVLAHQLSHYVLHRNIDLNVDTSETMATNCVDKGETTELVANCVARHLIGRCGKAGHWGIEKLIAVQRTFFLELLLENISKFPRESVVGSMAIVLNRLE
jgi:hypothetical protein